MLAQEFGSRAGDVGHPRDLLQLRAADTLHTLVDARTNLKVLEYYVLVLMLDSSLCTSVLSGANEATMLEYYGGFIELYFFTPTEVPLHFRILFVDDASR